MNSQRFNLIIALIALVVAVATAWPQPARGNPRLGVTNFDSIHLSDTGGTATPVFLANQSGAGALAEFRDGSTPVASIYNGGNADFHGNQIDLDADNDTSITVDTDDQIDFEVGGSDVLRISTIGPVLVEASVFVITAGTTITPTTPYQPLTSTAEFTASAATAIVSGTIAGQILILTNENASDVIHIPDGANTALVSSAQVDLGPTDTLWLIWDGTDWTQLATSDN